MNNLLQQQNTRIGRNNPCYCGSGRKYKKCCLDNDKSHRLIVNYLASRIDIPLEKLSNITIEELDDLVEMLKIRGES